MCKRALRKRWRNNGCGRCDRRCPRGWQWLETAVKQELVEVGLAMVWATSIGHLSYASASASMTLLIPSNHWLASTDLTPATKRKRRAVPRISASLRSRPTPPTRGHCCRRNTSRTGILRDTLTMLIQPDIAIIARNNRAAAAIWSDRTNSDLPAHVLARDIAVRKVCATTSLASLSRGWMRVPEPLPCLHNGCPTGRVPTDELPFAAGPLLCILAN